MPRRRVVALGVASLLCLPMLLTPTPTEAQADATPVATAAPAPSRLTFWLSGGYGGGAAGQFDGMEEAVTLNLSAQRGPVLLSLRAAGVSSSIFDWSSDYGVLAGVASSPARPVHIGAALQLGRLR